MFAKFRFPGCGGHRPPSRLAEGRHPGHPGATRPDTAFPGRLSPRPANGVPVPISRPRADDSEGPTVKKTVMAAAAVVLPLFSTTAAVAEPVPVLPGPASVLAQDPVPAGPLGTTFPVRTGGDMAVTIRPAETAVVPRADGQQVLVYDVTAEQTAGNPYFLPTLDLRMVTADGTTVYALTDVPGEYPAGFLEPGQPRHGLVAFGIGTQQTPAKILFATSDYFVQSSWTL